MKQYEIESIFDSSGLSNTLYSLKGIPSLLGRASSLYGYSSSDEDLRKLQERSEALCVRTKNIVQYLTQNGFHSAEYIGGGLLSGGFVSENVSKPIYRKNILGQVLRKEKGIWVSTRSADTDLRKEVKQLAWDISRLPLIEEVYEFQALYDADAHIFRIIDTDAWEVDPALLEAYRD